MHLDCARAAQFARTIPNASFVQQTYGFLGRHCVTATLILCSKRIEN